MTRAKIKKEPRTPMYLHLPTPLKQDLTKVAVAHDRKEREIVISALTMYLAYVAAQPAPAVAQPQEGA